MRWIDLTAEATVVLDALLEGRLAWRDSEGAVQDAALRAMKTAVMREATRQAAAEYRRRRLRRHKPARWTAWGHHGMFWQYERGGEHHAICSFCWWNLETLGKGSHRLTRAWIDRIESHTIACACVHVLGEQPYFAGTGFAVTRSVDYRNTSGDV